MNISEDQLSERKLDKIHYQISNIYKKETKHIGYGRDRKSEEFLAVKRSMLQSLSFEFRDGTCNPDKEDYSIKPD